VRLHAFCLGCHRLRRCTVRDVDAMLAAMRGGTAVGVCDECAEAADPPPRRR
jgi:hypothetical protein